MIPDVDQHAAYRGIFVPGDRHSSNRGLGVHWSASQRVAEEMAAHASVAPIKRTPHPNDQTIIYRGAIPNQSIETDINVLKQNKVLSPEDLSKNKEKEIPVKKGAKVLVSSMTRAKQRNGVWKSRERRYNPPRESEA